MPTTNLGRVAIVPQGAYSAAVEYKKLDLVNGTGGAYLYVNDTPSTGAALTDTDYWQQIAAQGLQGIQGEGIASIVKTAGDGSPGTSDTYTITFTDDTTTTFTVWNGATGPQGPTGLQGDTGNGITSILRTTGDGSPGTTDTYTITYTDETTATFTVYNGQDYAQDMPLTWAEFKNHVRQGSITDFFVPGDQFVVTHATRGDIVFNVADITDKDGTGFVAPTGYYTQFPNAKPVTLLMDRCIYGAQFDAPEANYKVLAAIPQGAVNITLATSLIDGGNPIQYDLTVPAGGFAKNSLLRISSATNLQYYATPTSTVIDVAMQAGIANTPLTVSPTAGAQLSEQNHKDRVMYGSNNYAQSALRQWLNAAGLKKTFWTPKSIYDLPPTWYDTWDGFLNGMDAEFVAAVGATTRIVANNTVTDGGGSYTIADKFFFPSAMEIYATEENNVAEGVQFDAYVGLADLNKIKYQYAAPSTVGYWWLRSPNAGNAHRPRHVHYTTGALNYNVASSSYGAAAACVIL